MNICKTCKQIIKRKNNKIYCNNTCRLNRNKVNGPHESKEVSWFLGVLSGDGYTGKKGMALTVTQPNFAKEFKRIGDKILGIKGKWYEYDSENQNHSKTYTVIYYSSKLKKIWGDFSGGNWHSTIQNKYDWILTDISYIYSFLSGYFDSEGSVEDMRDSTSFSKIRCRISIGYWKPALFISYLLTKCNIDHTFHKRSESDQKHKVKGISINGIQNTINFSKIIKCSVLEKQKRLSYIRSLKIIDHSEWIEQMYNRFLELNKSVGPAEILRTMISEGYGEHNFYPITKYKIKNWRNSNQDPTNKKGNHHIEIVSV